MGRAERDATLSNAAALTIVALAWSAGTPPASAEGLDGKEVGRYMERVRVKNGAWVTPKDADLSRPRWREAMDAHRARQRRTHGHLDRPEKLKKSFVEGFAFLYDRRLYDAEEQRWRIAEFLDRGEREFGGYDQVILWQSYPRLGIDERNQFDYYRDLPGGLGAVREWSELCHRRGVRVLITYNPWDRHTRDGGEHLRDVLEALKLTGADGVFLDTLGEVPQGWAKALKELRREVLFESEGHPWDERIIPMHSAWGQGWQVHPPAQIFNTRWIWPAHKTFLTHHRHSRDHWDEVCCAWFTGTGVLVWEVVFGNDTAWVERDKALLRAVKPLLQAFWQNFAHPDWQPFIASGHKELKVNLWPGELGTVYTLCWPRPAGYRGPLFAAREGRTYLDLVTGRKLSVEGGMVLGRVGARSVGGVLEVERVTGRLRSLLKRVCPGKLPRYVDVRTSRIPPVGRVDHRLGRLNRYRGRRPEPLPPGMVWVPSGKFVMRVDHPWHGASCYDHYGWGKKGKAVQIQGFAIDACPVTNQQFAEFLSAAGYQLPEKHNFLKHWPGGKMPKRLASHPVVYVSLDDARAYAKWAGKRLPTEAEWQYAAGGLDDRPWPWGRRFAPTRVNPGGGTMPVGAFPKDASPFGLHDLCGHVWQWLDDTYTDRVHSFTVLKGGSFFRLPKDASKWYVHTGPLKLTSHVKLPLLSPSLDRFSTVGFRCVID